MGNCVAKPAESEERVVHGATAAAAGMDVVLRMPSDTLEPSLVAAVHPEPEGAPFAAVHSWVHTAFHDFCTQSQALTLYSILQAR